MADSSFDEGDGGDEGGAFSERPTCCSLICGIPTPDEPKVNFICFRISRRVIKNVLMFVIVLVFYMLFLSFIMGGSRSTPVAPDPQ